MRVFSYGGGVQSTAALVLAAQERLRYRTFLFCNVGDDSENPATIEYVNDVARPYAASHGVELIELRKVLRTGQQDTLFQRLTKPGSKSIGIPVRMNGSGAPGRRSCTADFKITVVDRWLREHGGKSGSVVGLGISLDEIERMKPNSDPDTMAWKENAFPLIEEVNRPLTRQDCMNVIASAGLPVPPKSSCYFCPFHKMSVWQEMRQDQPELFWKSVELEAFLNKRRASLGMDAVWFSGALKPLDQATHEYGQQGLFDEAFEGCESGYCMV